MDVESLFIKLGERIDNLEAEIKRQGKELGERIDNLEAGIKRQGKELGERIDNLEAGIKRIDNLEAEINRLDRSIRRQLWRVEDLEEELYSMKKALYRRKGEPSIGSNNLVADMTPALGGIRGCDWDDSCESLD